MWQTSFDMYQTTDVTYFCINMFLMKRTTIIFKNIRNVGTLHHIIFKNIRNVGTLHHIIFENMRNVGTLHHISFSRI